MKTYLVTGGAGFIGSNFVIYMLNKYDDIKIINVDKLTYAGNLENLKSVENDPRYSFVQADICDREAISKIFAENDVDYVVNFAAESHVDRSITNPEIFVKTNVEGTVNMLQCAKVAWTIGDDQYKPGVKYLQVSTDEVYGSLGETGYFMETTPLDPHSPYSSSKASADFFVKAFGDTYKFPINITRCSNVPAEGFFGSSNCVNLMRKYWRVVSAFSILSKLFTLPILSSIFLTSSVCAPAKWKTHANDKKNNNLFIL